MIYSLSETIKSLRISTGMNQVQFGNMIGVSKQCVSNWENDNVLPSIEMLEKIANVFCVTTDYLLGRDNTKLIDVSKLTEEQRGHIALLINDLACANLSKQNHR